MVQLAKLLTVTALVSLLCTAGCGSGEEKSKDGDKPDAHHHHHDDELGPNKGHLLHFEPHDLQGEWLHDSTGKITIIVLDAKKLEVPVAFGEVRIDVEIGDKVTPYVLRPENASDGKASRFAKTDPELLTHLNIVGGRLVAEFDGQMFTAKIEKHADHQH